MIYDYNRYNEHLRYTGLAIYRWNMHGVKTCNLTFSTEREEAKLIAQNPLKGSKGRYHPMECELSVEYPMWILDEYNRRVNFVVYKDRSGFFFCINISIVLLVQRFSW